MRRERWGKTTSLLAAAISAGLGLAACGGKQAPAPEPEVSVQAARVERTTIENVISAEAVLYPRTESPIVPKISAPIERFYVERGSRVRAGELVATLENKDLKAAVEEAKGAYEQAQATYAASTRESLPQEVQSAELNVRATKQAAETEQLVYDSRLKLYKAGAISRNLLDEAQVAYIQAENQYKLAESHLQGLRAVGQQATEQSAQGELGAAKGRYDAALANLAYSRIVSPVTGVVTDRPLYEGQMASAGTPIMTVMDLSEVVGRMYLSPQQAAQIAVGDAATMSTAAGAADVGAKVSVVSPALDPGSTTVQVWVAAANPGDRLKPGATVEVSIVAQTVKDALVVPAEAVLKSPDGTQSVMVIGADDHAHQTAVKTGIRSNRGIEILSGLRSGERVVTTGSYALPDGAKVKVVAASESGAKSGD